MPLQANNITPESLVKRLSVLSGAKVLIVGDIMLDEYLLGDAARISPEAPVPVVLVEEERFMLGGAGNVARNISALGGNPILVSACGDGAGSSRLHDVLHGSGLTAHLVPLAGRPAATKTRVMARGQQLVRIDREDVSPLGNNEVAGILELVEKHWADSPIMIISDYNKGIISSGLIAGLAHLRSKKGRSPRILVDPKTGNFHLYRDMDLLTPNTQETGEGAGLPVRNAEEIIVAGRAIIKKLGCKELLTTLGAKGMALFAESGEVLHIPTVARKVFDVSGAGDTVIAAIGLCMAAGLSVLEACIIANFAAGDVVAEVGAAVTTRENVAEAILRLGDLPVERWA